MKADELDPVLLGIEADYAAQVFAGYGEEELDPQTLKAAREEATFIDAISLDGGDRLVSVWRIDEQLVLVSALAAGEGEPLHEGWLLEN